LQGILGPAHHKAVVYSRRLEQRSTLSVDTNKLTVHMDVPEEDFVAVHLTPAGSK
jgi:hypothetical protein